MSFHLHHIKDCDPQVIYSSPDEWLIFVCVYGIRKSHQLKLLGYWTKAMSWFLWTDECKALKIIFKWILYCFYITNRNIPDVHLLDRQSLRYPLAYIKRILWQLNGVVCAIRRYTPEYNHIFFLKGGEIWVDNQYSVSAVIVSNV